MLDKATDKSPVELAFDWLWNMPEVSTVLSGMSSMEMLQEDIAFAEKAKPGMLSAEDTAVIEQLRESFNQFSVVPCTGCNYCVEYCPEKIVIRITSRHTTCASSMTTWIWRANITR